MSVFRGEVTVDVNIRQNGSGKSIDDASRALEKLKVSTNGGTDALKKLSSAAGTAWSVIRKAAYILPGIGIGGIIGGITGAFAELFNVIGGSNVNELVEQFEDAAD